MPQISLPPPCRPHFGAQISAAGRCAAMAPKALIVGGFSPPKGLFSGAERRVLPVELRLGF